MSTASPTDARKNAAVAHAMVENESAPIAAQVGLHALAELADMMPHEEFLEFVNNSVQAATTGQQPKEDNEAQENQ